MLGLHVGDSRSNPRTTICFLSTESTIAPEHCQVWSTLLTQAKNLIFWSTLLHPYKKKSNMFYTSSTYQFTLTTFKVFCFFFAASTKCTTVVIKVVKKKSKSNFYKEIKTKSTPRFYRAFRKPWVSWKMQLTIYLGEWV